MSNMTLEELRNDAKVQAGNWEIDWEVLDSDVGYHDDFQKLLKWANEFDIPAAEDMYDHLYHGRSPINTDEPISLPQDEVNGYLDEAAHTIREAYILRELGERYNLIMEITESNV